MKLRTLFLLCLLGGMVWGIPSCTYSNDDNPNEYPTPEPEPEPEPDPEPQINEKYLKAIYSPNCWMAKPQTTINIPILKAYAMWSLYGEWLSRSDFSEAMPRPVVVWQDAPTLVKTVGIIEGTTKEDSQLIVTVGNEVGNAVVGIEIDGEIRWSWHVWVTRYDPDAELVVYGKTYSWDNDGDHQADYVFMDRNLGATIDKPVLDYTPQDSLAACGLLYQWGRKDPFPADHHFRYTNVTDYGYFDSKPIYNFDGEQLTEGVARGGTGIQSIPSDEDVSITNLEKSILHPMQVILGKSSYSDWYTSEQPLSIDPCDTLWSEHRGKTPFDPCPEGWRVPSDKNERFVWQGLEGRVTTDFSPLGMFPYAGFRYRTGGGCLKNSGFSACLWTGTQPKVGNAYYLSVYISPSMRQPEVKRDVASRSDGRSVRCVKCE